MNERIKQLAEEAGVVFVPATTCYFGDTYPASMLTDRIDVKKFAQLIVRECVMIIEHGMDHTEYNDSEKSMVELEAQRWCRTAIKEHFGVDNK